MGRKPAPCQGWYVAPVPTRNTRAAPGSQGTAHPLVFPHYPRYLAADREANGPVSANSPRTFLLAQLFLHQLGRSGWGGTTMLNRNGHSPHQGTPMSPTGTMPLASQPAQGTATPRI